MPDIPLQSPSFISETVLPRTAAIASFLDELLSNNLNNHRGADQEAQQLLTDAMRYAVGGKMLRPYLLIELSNALGITMSPEHKLTQAVVIVGAAIEMIHSYSLIHDDLPAMDNDDYRRGKPSCHKKFGEAIALLAGNALMNTAMEIILNQLPQSLGDDENAVGITSRILRLLTQSIGIQGLIGGQAADMLKQQNEKVAAGNIHNREQWLQICRMKTGALFSAAAAAAGIIADLPQREYARLQEFGSDIGILFQMVDDVRDGDLTQEHRISQDLNSVYDNCSKYLASIEQTGNMDSITRLRRFLSYILAT